MKSQEKIVLSIEAHPDDAEFTCVGTLALLIEVGRATPKLKTFVDYILYFDSMEQRIREMVKNGQFGTVTQIQVN